MDYSLSLLFFFEIVKEEKLSHNCPDVTLPLFNKLTFLSNLPKIEGYFERLGYR